MILGLLVFVLALQLLRKGAGVYGQSIIQFLDISNPVNSLGFGWLLSYIFLSGSPVAAVAISFFASGTIDAMQTFTMITGSRLGASFIVLFVGFMYYLRGQRHPASISTGVLALLTTAAIYIPALIPGYWLLATGAIGVLRVDNASEVNSWLGAIFEPIVNFAGTWLPGWALLLTGVIVLLVAFNLLDQALPNIDPERSAFRRIGKLIYRPWAMFLLGALVTSITMSVSVSLSLLVPLSIKGMVRRENTLPYIMGANITTFIDTLFAALVVGGPVAFTIVFVEMISVAILSILVLLFCYRPFQSSILRIQEWVVRSRRTLAIFLGAMLLVPALLLLL
ncbi:MAG: hypothetical protein HC914_03705 [Chloroflexaceae bacterium]|nr:hypothetical protein [Chloroflexaceae bacterium]